MEEEKQITITADDYEDFYFETPLSETLDQVLDYARRGNSQFGPWIPVSGLPGSGKTSIIKAWLRHNRLKNWYIEGSRRAKEMKVERYPASASKPGVHLVSGEDLASLLTPKEETISVLFSAAEIEAVDGETVIVIDDYDRFDEKERAILYELIRHHRVEDERGETTILHPLMLIVVLDACNLGVLNAEEKRLLGFSK